MILVTLGDSWVRGRYPLKQKNWMRILGEHYNFKCNDLSEKGASNWNQFRKATQYFNQNIDPKEVIVLWGINTLYSDEIYMNGRNAYTQMRFSAHTMNPRADRKFRHNNYDYSITRHYEDHFDIDIIEERTRDNIRLWQKYFDMSGIRNLWYDIHNETNTITANKVVFPHQGMQDLVSQTIASRKVYEQDRHHFATGYVDCDRIGDLRLGGLVDDALLPTQDGHNEIAMLFEKALKDIL
tara:strand:+ start:3601 stop:4317 length:717 start_codon:yes stop_codon:yes gene_type:complete